MVQTEHFISAKFYKNSVRSEPYLRFTVRKMETWVDITFIFVYIIFFYSSNAAAAWRAV